MEKQNNFLTWLSLSPVLLFAWLSFTAVLLIAINTVYPDALAWPFWGTWSSCWGKSFFDGCQI